MSQEFKDGLYSVVEMTPEEIMSPAPASDPLYPIRTEQELDYYRVEGEAVRIKEEMRVDEELARRIARFVVDIRVFGSHSWTAPSKDK